MGNVANDIRLLRQIWKVGDLQWRRYFGKGNRKYWGTLQIFISNKFSPVLTHTQNIWKEKGKKIAFFKTDFVKGMMPPFAEKYIVI